MRRKHLIAAVLGFGFLGTTYVAVSQTSSGLLAPFMVKRCTSITVGGSVKCNSITERPMTLQDVERCIGSIKFPAQEQESTAAQHAGPQSDSASLASLTAPSTMAGPAAQEVQDNPVLAFASGFTCPDDLAEGVLARNAQEQLWNADGLFHVIERSRKCSSTKIDDLRGSYCSCPH
jgi:hypothetical protein